MSMLTAQCKRLRKVAYEVERIKNNNADRLPRDSIKLAEAASEMRDAADTIDELRSMLQETCHLVDNDSGPNMHCSECDGQVDDEYLYFAEEYGYTRCPHCGRRIVECE